MPLAHFSRRWFIASQFAFLCNRLCAAEPTWEQDVNHMLGEFLACQTPIDDRSPCNYFLARAIQRVYGVSDFFRSPNVPMSASTIAQFVASDSKWTGLGNCDKQYNLDQAQGYANLKKPVVAVYSAQPHGHVAMILPGSSAASASWGVKVPNSASFPLDNPKGAYVGGPLSKAFGADKKEQVLLFGRNFSPAEDRPK